MEASLFGHVLVWGYRNVVNSLCQGSPLGRLRIAFFIVAVLYNITEAGFKVTHPIWIAFLLAIVVVPKLPLQESRGPSMRKNITRGENTSVINVGHACNLFFHSGSR